MSNLEQYLTAITGRLQQQEALIAALQTAVTAHVSVSAFSSFSGTLMQHMEKQEARLDAMQRSIDALTTTSTQHTSELANHSTQLRALSDKCAAAATLTYTDERLSAVTDTLTTSIDALRAATAPLTAHQRLDSSVHMMASQMAAVQSTIAHKLDRAELPLIEGMATTVGEYAHRLDDMDRRVDGIEQAVDAARVEADGAVGRVKADVEGRWQRLSEEVGDKVGMDWLQQNVVDALRDVQDELTAYAAHDDTMRHILDQQQQLHDKVRRAHHITADIHMHYSFAPRTLPHIAIFCQCKRPTNVVCIVCFIALCCRSTPTTVGCPASRLTLRVHKSAGRTSSSGSVIRQDSAQLQRSRR